MVDGGWWIAHGYGLWAMGYGLWFMEHSDNDDDDGSQILIDDSYSYV